MAGSFEQLNQQLSMIEDAVLGEVHAAKWEAKDGAWQPEPSNLGNKEFLSKNWKVWRDGCEKITSKTPYEHNPRLQTAINTAEQAVKFQFTYAGAAQSRWKVVFQYERAFRVLSDIIGEMARQFNEITTFAEIHEKKLYEFQNQHSGKWNIFVAITYDDSDEVTLIRQSLKDLEVSYNHRIKFHYAEDKKWLPELYSNLMFYMVACGAGLVFLTKSNFTEKGTLHNSNVAFEFGFIAGLGKKCEMIHHESVGVFTDVRGLLISSYNRTIQVKDKVGRFIHDDLGITPA